MQLGGGGMEMGEANFQIYTVVISNFNTILEALEQSILKKWKSFKIKLGWRFSALGMWKIPIPHLSATLSQDAAMLEQGMLCSFSLHC